MPSLTTLKILGVASVASYAVARVAFKAGWLGWYRQHVVAISRDRLPAMPRGFVVRALGAEELARHSIDADSATQAARFAAGLDCIGVFTPSGALAGVVWMGAAVGQEGNVDVRFVLPGHAAWDTGMWIHPDHRLGRAFAALWAGVGDWLDTHGLTHSYSVIADYNVASLTAHRRLGMQDLATLLVIRIGRWQWISRGGARWRLASADRPLSWTLPMVREASSLAG